MVTAVDLDQLAIALASQTGLVEASALLARLPETFFQHPRAQRLAANLDLMLRKQNFRRQRRPEVSGLRLDQIENVLPNASANAVVRRLTSTLMDQPAATV